MGTEPPDMSSLLHLSPSRNMNQFRDQYAPNFQPYTSSCAYPGAETDKYRPAPSVGGRDDPRGSSEFAARAGEHGGSFYNHRASETGWTSGPYSGHDSRHAGFNPGPHHFNSGYHQTPEHNVELRRPFCGMTQTRTQKCSPLQESMRLMHQQRRNAHEFTPDLREEEKLRMSHTLSVYPSGMYHSHSATRICGDKLTHFGGDKYGPHAYDHYPAYNSSSPTIRGGMWASPRLGLESRGFHDGSDACRVTETGPGTWLKSDSTRGGQFDAPRWNDTSAGRVERSGMTRDEAAPHADAHHE